jgi:molybdopterin-guanine dinucleotide biosynthesis protein A
MGRPKAWLDLDGTPLLRHVVNVIRGCCPTVIVVGSPGQELPSLGEGIVRVDDPHERAHEGPLTGIITGLRTLRGHPGELTYLGSCDSVFITRAHVEFVLAKLASNGDIDAVVPAEGSGAHIHALASAVRAPVALVTAEKLFGAGERAATSLFTRLETCRVPVEHLPDPRAVTTCNTPAEWRAVLRDTSER